MDRKLKDFVNQVVQKAGGNLVSFVVYGSAATGDSYKTSDINTLLVLKKFSAKTLKDIAGPVNGWVKHGNPAPLIFTRRYVLSSTDVFPVEFLDIKDNRLVLYGRDIFKEIKVGKKNLRLEIEREFKSALLRVMRAYMLTGGHHGKIKNLMRDSLSTFTTLFRATLRLYGKKVPVTKKSIIEQCAITLKLNSGLLFDILMLKEGRDTIEKNADEYFTRYIAELDKASEKIDKF